MSPYLLHVTPNICIVFLIYEKVTSYVHRKDLEAAMETVSMPKANQSGSSVDPSNHASNCKTKMSECPVVLVTSNMPEPVEVVPLPEPSKKKSLES